MRTKKRNQKRKKMPSFAIVLLILFALFLPILIFVIPSNQVSEQQTHAATGQMNHFFGAFSIGSAVSAASSVGLTADLEYGYNPVAGDSKSSAMKAANLQIIDDMPDEYIRQFAKDNSMPNLVSSMTTHLKAVQNNSQIIAYWVLDDTNGAGTAKAALVQVTSLIHQYTPGKPSICGFTGNSRPWPASKADNFSPQGCDMIAPYIYPQGGQAWNLSDILPTMEAAFKARGWNIANTPMVGVPLSYGGANGYTLPTAAQEETETKAFCQAGATAIIYYDFRTGTNGSTDAGVQQGIKAGIADCKTIWGTTATAPGTSGTPPSIVPTFFCAGGTNCAGSPAPTTPIGSGTPNSSPAVPLTSNTPSGGTINGYPLTSPFVSNPVTAPSPITGNGDIIALLKQFLKFLEDLIQQLFGGSTSHPSRHHHNK